MFDSLVKVIGSSAIDPASILGSSKLRQNCGVGQEIANSAGFLFFKNLNCNPSLNRTYLMASFRRFGVLAKAM